MRKALLAAGAIAALAVAGCGSSSSTTPTKAPAGNAGATSTAAPTTSTPAASGSSTLSIASNPSGMLTFSTMSLSAKAGKVTIAFTNNASLDHNFTVATPSGSVVGATPTFKGGTKTVTLTLKAGTYTYYCSVPGHESGGMKGTLVVT